MNLVNQAKWKPKPCSIANINFYYKILLFEYLGKYNLLKHVDEDGNLVSKKFYKNLKYIIAEFYL